jgi:DUF4097 and DUF4098 domain-containing protein YvlB
MNRQRLATWAGAILGVGCALLLAAYAHASDYSGKVTEEFHHTYPLSSGGRVELDNVHGDVHITGWDRDEVKVDAVKFAHGKDQLNDVEIQVEADSNSVSIRTKYHSHNHYFGTHHDSASVEYTLSVPRNARLDEIKLVNGPLDIHGVAGEVHASCINGRLFAEGLQGRVQLSTVNGRSEVRFDRLSDSIDLSSVNGGIVLVLPSDANARIEASTVSGGIDNDFGLHSSTHRWVGHNLDGELGSGGPHIKLSNVNGRIDIRHADDGKPLSRAKDFSHRDRDDNDDDEI